MRYLAFVVAMLAGATAAFGQIDAFTVSGGYSWGSGSVGAEVAYMSARGDLGRLGATAWERRAGVFVRFRF